MYDIVQPMTRWLNYPFPYKKLKAFFRNFLNAIYITIDNIVFIWPWY